MNLERPFFTKDHELFRSSFREFVKKEVIPQQEEWQKAGVVTRDIWKRCGDLGFLCPQAPEEYGGLGTDFLYEVIISEELAYAAESGLMLSLHNSLVAPYIYDYATEELKKHLIPKIISGDVILAVAMTEPDAGSDLASMKSTAEDRGDHFIVNGAKTFISNGLLSDAVVVAARMNPEEKHSMGLFVIERGWEGFERGRKLLKMGMHSQDTTELSFNNVKVPKSHVLGHPAKGFQYLMEKLAIERLSLAISSVAIAEQAVKETIKYVKERKAFGKTISQFQNTQFKIAEMQTETQVGRAYVDKLIEAELNGKLTSAEACAAKYWTTDMVCRVTDEAVQLHGGYGYMMEYPICRMFADSRVGRIYAGTNEIMKTVIAKSMGI